MKETKIFHVGEKKPFRWEYGPVSFGFIIKAAVVSWSGQSAKDLLISRAWEGIWLYPSRTLSDDELNMEPIKVCGDIVAATMGYPVDWNKDGADDLIVSDRSGFIYFLERRGEYPNIKFEMAGPLREKESNLAFNFPYENPNHEEVNDLGGWIEPHFYNYTYPIRYPMDNRKSVHLIIGDWAGNLWWLPDLSQGDDLPCYKGVHYAKPNKSKSYAKGYIRKYGTEYVKPEQKICDENGAPYLLGEGIDSGSSFAGGDTRPVLYRNAITNSNDLLVLAGIRNIKIYYLQRVTRPDSHKPVFKNLGEVKIDGIDISQFGLYVFHSALITHETEGWNDLMISIGCKMAVLKNKRLNNVLPEFEFSHWVSASDSRAFGVSYTEIIKDVNGKRFFLEGDGIKWELREIKKLKQDIKLAGESILLKDQNGVFRVEGETDPQGGKDWGWHRAMKWDFDKSGKQHLIVGTDRGLLYLLIDEGDLGKNGEFRFRSVGPLKDAQGKIIRVHNRVCAVGIDLNGDGLEDLIVGGVTYQRGLEFDPDPGAGIYAVINKGPDENGLPILATPKPIRIKGWKPRRRINTDIHMQSVDIDRDGEKEIIVSVRADGLEGRVCKPSKERVGLEYTGIALPRFVDEWILDVDDDGEWELVFAGRERGLGYYRKIQLP